MMFPALHIPSFYLPDSWIRLGLLVLWFCLGSIFKTQAQNYCVPSYSNSCSSGDRITKVLLVGETQTLDNFTECSNDNYGDYTNETNINVPDLKPGETYTIQVETDYNMPELESVRVWIDYDQDENFAEVETIGESNNVDGMSNGLFVASFTVPLEALPGNTRMRVRLVYNQQDIQPCVNYSYGETEDYLVEIIEPCTAPIEIVASSTQICPEEGASLTATGGEGGTIYFQGTNPYNQQTNLGGNSVTVTEPGTYYFRAYNTEEDCWSPAVGLHIFSFYGPENIQIFASETDICIGESFQLFADADMPTLSNMIYQANDYSQFQYWTEHYKYDNHNEWNRNYTDYAILGNIPVMRYDYNNNFTGYQDVENYIKSPLINAVAYSSIQLSFRHYLSDENHSVYGEYNYDIKAQISLDENTWETLYSGGNPPQNNIGPQTQNINLPNVYDYRDFYIRFVVEGDETGMWYWEIDDIEITGTPDAQLNFSWTGPNSFTSNEQNPNISNVGLENQGEYEVTVTYGNCSVVESILVNIESCYKEVFINPQIKQRTDHE